MVAMTQVTDASPARPFPDDAASEATRAPRLRPAVTATPKDLTPEIRAAIKPLMGARPMRFLVELAFAWAVIVGAAWAAIASGSLVVTILAILLIGARQVVLGLLMHEQVHHLGLRGRWADTIVNAFAVYPLLVTTVEDYAEVHLRHHRHFMTNRDPDFIRKSGRDWRFPMPIGQLAKIVTRDLLALNVIALIRGKTAPAGDPEFRRAYPTPKWFRAAWFVAVFSIITALDAWQTVLIFWLLPLLTVAQLGVRWIAVLEHEYEHTHATVAGVTPLIRLRWYERLVFHDLNFALHVYHHNHAGVSFSNLPRVHAIYQAHGLVDEDAFFPSGLSYIRYLVGGPQGATQGQP